MFQERNGDPKPEHKWRSEDRWKRQYPRLFPDSSSGLGDDQEQVGHRNNSKEGIGLTWVLFLKFISGHSL